jgi:hypothetical protein
VGLERGQLNLVSIIDELLKRNISGSGIRRAIPLYIQKLTLTSPTSGGRSVGIFRSRTKAETIPGHVDLWPGTLTTRPERRPFKALVTSLECVESADLCSRGSSNSASNELRKSRRYGTLNSSLLENLDWP